MNVEFYQIAKKPIEDSFFICKKEQIFGVADGVGGWRREDIDPYRFSKELMDNCKYYIENKKLDNLRKIISEAHNMGRESGSSTFCLAKIKGMVLTTLNLGDSSCIVIRDKKNIFRTQEKIHEFNHPFQIARKYGERKKDSPEDAVEEKTRIEKGDVIILSTDGLTDNLFDYEIIEKLGETDFTRKLADKANDNAHSNNKKTPFSKKSGRIGGKLDDITIISIIN